MIDAVVKCPACAGKGQALVKLLQTGEQVPVTLFRCSKTVCALCSGDGRLPLERVLERAGVVAVDPDATTDEDAVAAHPTVRLVQMANL